MTPAETLTLCRFVAAACPQQAFDKYTPDTWHDLLGDLVFDDCRAAAIAVARRQPFVAPSEIRQGVLELRSERLRQVEIPEPPPELMDDPAGYLAAVQAAARAIGDGRDPMRAMRAVAEVRRLELGAGS